MNDTWRCDCCGKRFGFNVPMYTLGNSGKVLCAVCYDGDFKGANEKMGREVVSSIPEGAVGVVPYSKNGKMGCSFSTALQALKDGQRVCRSGWNGKGMWLLLIHAENYDVFNLPEASRRLPWIGMKTADNGFVPWLASQTDLLADDWMIVL